MYGSVMTGSSHNIDVSNWREVFLRLSYYGKKCLNMMTEEL